VKKALLTVLVPLRQVAHRRTRMAEAERQMDRAVARLNAVTGQVVRTVTRLEATLAERRSNGQSGG
jgi:hypothetical protein